MKLPISTLLSNSIVALLVMESRMARPRMNAKIFFSVVRFIAVQMMDMLTRIQFSSELFLHYVTVLRNVFRKTSSFLMADVDIHISTLVKKFPALPSRVSVSVCSVLSSSPSPDRKFIKLSPFAHGLVCNAESRSHLFERKKIRIVQLMKFFFRWSDEFWHRTQYTYLCEVTQ